MDDNGYDIDYKSTKDKAVYRYRKCMVCGKKFAISVSDKRWCDILDHDLPTWCNRCRGLHHIQIMKERLKDGSRAK